MAELHLYVIAYDSRDDARRRRLARLLDNVAVRVQYSVFEGWLSDVQLERLVMQLADVVDAADDSIRLYRICAYCRDAAVHLGSAAPTVLEEVWIV